MWLQNIVLKEKDGREENVKTERGRDKQRGDGLQQDRQYGKGQSIRAEGGRGCGCIGKTIQPSYQRWYNNRMGFTFVFSLSLATFSICWLCLFHSNPKSLSLFRRGFGVWQSSHHLENCTATHGFLFPVFLQLLTTSDRLALVAALAFGTIQFLM